MPGYYYLPIGMLIYVVVSFGVAFLIGHKVDKKREDSIHDFCYGLATQLGAKITEGRESFFTVGPYAQYILSENFEGKNYAATYFAGTKSVLSYFKISLACPSRLNFSIRKETLPDGLGKKLHLIREVEIANEEFDQKYFIRGANGAAVKAYLMNQERRFDIDKLFDACPVKQINFKTGAIEVDLQGDTKMIFVSPVTSIITPALVKDVLATLAKLANG